MFAYIDIMFESWKVCPLRRGLSRATNRGQNGAEPKPGRQTMKKKLLYSGLDVHKKSIDVAITDERANGKVRSYGKLTG